MSQKSQMAFLRHREICVLCTAAVLVLRIVLCGNGTTNFTLPAFLPDVQCAGAAVVPPSLNASQQPTQKQTSNKTKHVYGNKVATANTYVKHQLQWLGALDIYNFQFR